MKEAFVSNTGAVTIRDSDIPIPGAEQILIRVVVSGINPKDWKYPVWRPDDQPFNHGDDIAGYVEQVGPGVAGFKKGDKVAAFHQMLSPHGSWADYAIAWQHTTFHLSPETSFEEAATVPLTAMTAALGLYQRLRLPLPWNPAIRSLPLVVYGGATAVGAFAIKLASLSNIHPIIVIAGRGATLVETLINRDKGDTIIDYREGDDQVRSKIAEAAGGLPIHHALDAVSEKGSHLNAAAALTAPGQITTVLPLEKAPDGIALSLTNVGSVHHPPPPGKLIEDMEFARVFFPFIGLALRRGWLCAHPFKVRKGGLAGIEGALRDLKDGKASAVKYVVRIGETI